MKIQQDLELEILQPTKMVVYKKPSKNKRKKWAKVMMKVKF